MQSIYIKTTRTTTDYQVWSIYRRYGPKARRNETFRIHREMLCADALGEHFKSAKLVRVHKKGGGLLVKGEKLRGMPLYMDLKETLESIGYAVHPA
jgi:hypothetical protein